LLAGSIAPAIGAQCQRPARRRYASSDESRQLRTLYVTSARHRLTLGQLAVEPLAGAVLALDPSVRGLAGNRFAG
jgi:hypothetical protein